MIPSISKRTEVILVAVIVGIALLLRIIAPWYAPRGWRDDELSSALVVTGHVLEGDFRVYYPDASGHEGLYEYFQAATMLLFGPNAWGIRGPSILFGAAAVLLTYLLTRRLFDWPTATLAAILLTVSFWSLMYSRTGQRHISVTVTTLLSFYFLWRGVQRSGDTPAWSDFALSGVFMGLGFYTYFASRGLPLIIIAWGLYLLIWCRDLWRQVWRGLVLSLIIALILSIPLAITLRQQPEAETRVNEVAVPIRDASEGNYLTLVRYTLTTLSMFTHNGDEEWLYNVPHRPVYAPIGAALFWIGIIFALFWTFGPRRDDRTAFLLLWLGAGLAPGALSVPAASLGHTILAQPAAMIFPALALTSAWQWFTNPRLRNITLALMVAMLGWEAYRGIYDYWVIWPDDPFNRTLHHTDLHEASRWLTENADSPNVAIGGFLVERWDQQAINIDLPGDNWHIRAFDPRTAYLEIPGGGYAVIPEYLTNTWGDTQLPLAKYIDAPYRIIPIPEPSVPNRVLARFDNGLTLNAYEAAAESDTLVVIARWHVESELDLPPFPLLAKPPAPGEDDRPRLQIFLQILDDTGQRVAGWDGLGVDPYTLRPSDVFHQQMMIPLDTVPAGTYQLVIGLYNPTTGERITDRLSEGTTILLEEWTR